MALSSCLTKQQIEENGGKVVENGDGSVSVFYLQNNIFVSSPLTSGCCKVLNPNYTFDINSQTCKWSESAVCGFSKQIDLVINPKGNDGNLFFVNSGNENCELNIEFDYLIKVKCEDLVNLANSASKTKKYSVETQKEIDELEIKILETNDTIEYLMSTIVDLEKQNKLTNYSIETKYFTSSETVIKTAVKDNFNNTAFGQSSTGDTSITIQPNQEKIPFQVKKIYCLTDSGLSLWGEYLGPVKFQAFLAGDSNSYNSLDVNLFISTHPQLSVAYECDTPFGTKTKLINDINGKMVMLTKLKTTLSSYESRLIDLSDNFIEVTYQSSNLCTSPTKALESFDLSVTLEMINDKTQKLEHVKSFPLFTIGENNLYKHIVDNVDSGLYVCGDPTINETGFTSCTPLKMDTTALTKTNVYSCNSLINKIKKEISSNNDVVIPINSFASNWLKYSNIITDKEIINKIKNKKIKFSININNACVDFCVLLDNIKLDKKCIITTNTETILTKSPGFEFTRVIDNKKSWIDTEELTEREFTITDSDGLKPIRQTDYTLNDERLILNSKEIDLDINIASAIETDVWCYLSDNPEILTGVTNCLPCGPQIKAYENDEGFIFQDSNEYLFQSSIWGNDPRECCGDNLIKFDELLTTDLSSIKTIEGFENLMVSELIDVKNRQTISGYATLRALYDRYMNSLNYTNTLSSKFDYLTMDKFAGLVGSYWIDLIEQVIPSTSLWGSVKIYTNTIFDQQKFRYKEYSSILCNTEYDDLTINNKFSGVFNPNQSVEVEVWTISSAQSTESTKCNTMTIKQMNCGSEFIGKIRTYKTTT